MALVAWSLSEREDVLLLTLFPYKPQCFSCVHVYANLLSQEQNVCIITESTPAFFLLKGQVTMHTNVPTEFHDFMVLRMKRLNKLIYGTFMLRFVIVHYLISIAS